MMIDDDLRSLGSSGLSDQERNDLRNELLDMIRSEPTAPVIAAPARRRGRRRAVVIGAVAIAVGSATATAAYVGFVRPDPQQAGTVIANSRDEADAHVDGWRPELNAELVNCDAPDGSTDFEVYASSTPLDATVGAGDLVAACQAKAGTLDQPGGARPPSLCRTGTEGAPTFASPTVRLDGGDCPGDGLDRYTQEDVADLNEARSAEVALLAIDDPCPSRADAVAWVDRQVEQTGADLTVVDAGTAGTPPEVCFGTFVNWVAGTATVDAVSFTDQEN